MSLLDDDVPPREPPTILHLCALASDNRVVSYQIAFSYYFEHASCMLDQLRDPSNWISKPDASTQALQSLCQITNTGMAYNRNCAWCHKPLFPRD